MDNRVSMVQQRSVAIEPSRRSSRALSAALLLIIGGLIADCTPDDSPLRAENENLRKQVAKQESVVASLQDGNKVMQQQIDLLNRELRDAKKEAERAEAEMKALTAKLEAQAAEARKLAAQVQRTAATNAQMAQNLRVDDKGAQVEELPRPLAAVIQAAEEALARNGYTVKVSVKTDQKAVYVTERKVSAPASLEVSGFRNQYLVSLQALPSNVTRLSVKAEFEKMAQGGRVLTVSAEETAEIERRLIAEISKALSLPHRL